MRKLLLLAIGLATLLPVWTTFSATPQIAGGFYQINMQDGGYLTGIVQHWSGRLIARTDGGGIYRSDNQGNMWTYLGSNTVTVGSLCVQGIAVPQTTNSSSNLILQAVGQNNSSTDPGNGVWKSSDGGATWSHTLSNVVLSGNGNERIGGECLIFNPTNDNEVWAGTCAKGLWVSEDGGNTWLENGSLETNICATIYIHPLSPNPVFYGGDGGLWVSTNHGTNWTQIYTNALVYRVACGADGTVYFGGGSGSPQLIQKITSTNWGNTASYVYSNLVTNYQNGIGNSGRSLNTVTVLKDGRLVVGDNDSDTRISSNEGTSFTTMSFTYAPDTVVPQWASYPSFGWKPTCLIQDVDYTNFWYGGAGYGPIATTNSGTNWQYIPDGIGEVVTWRIGFHPTDTNRLYIPCSDLGGAIVTDAGISGNTAAIGHQYFPSDGCCCQVSHRALSCYTNGYNRVIFPGGNECSSYARLYATTNDGTNWYFPGGTNLPTTTANTIIVDAIDSLDNPDDFLVICGGPVGTNTGGLYRTTNGGNSFTQVNWSLTNNPAVQMGGNYFYGYLDRDATNVNVRYLFSHWAFPGNPATTNTGGGFYVSQDRGVTWTQQTGSTGAIIAGDYSDWIGRMASDHAISGSVWIAIDTSGPGKNGLAHSYTSGSNNNFYAVPNVTNAACVDAYNGNVVFYGEMTGDTFNKIYYSTNNGTNWGQVTATNYEFGNAEFVSLDPHWPGRIFIGTEERSVGVFVPAASRITPTITSWPTATAITYGQTLANSTLGGGSTSTGGSFAFTTPSTAPGAGAAMQSVTFTPTNSVYYSNVVGAVSVSVTVNPLPVILMGTEAYDGSTNAPASVLSVSNVVGIDNVTVASGYATLAGSAVGVQPITGFSTLFLGGAQVANYTLTGASGAVTVTNSFNPVSITSAALDVTGTNLVFSWQSVPGVVYTVLTNNALTPIQSWSVAGTLVTATNTNASVTLPGVVLTGSNLFVAIKQQ